MKKNLMLLCCGALLTACTQNSSELLSYEPENEKSGDTELVCTTAIRFTEALNKDTKTRGIEEQLGIRSLEEMKLPRTRANNEEIIIYTVHFSKNKGSVLLLNNKENSIVPIAYLEDEPNINTQEVLNDTTSILSSILNNIIDDFLSQSGPTTRGINDLSQRWEITEKTEPKCKTNWYQLSPYNQYCKNKDNQLVPAGCIAVAGAQALSVLQPQMNNIVTDWTTLVEKGNSSPQYQKEAAKLIYTVGINSGLNYLEGKTGTNSLDELVKYFQKLNLKLCKTNYIIDVLKTNHGIVVAKGYRARHGWIKRHYYDGHAFVIDAYAKFNKKDDPYYLHINYGDGRANMAKHLYAISTEYNWDDDISNTDSSDKLMQYPYKNKYYCFARSEEIMSFWLQE